MGKTTWKKGRGKLGFLQPLLGRWTAMAEGDVMGPVRCTRAFSAVLEGAYVRLEARWELNGGAKIYEEEALIGAGLLRALEQKLQFLEGNDVARGKVMMPIVSPHELPRSVPRLFEERRFDAERRNSATPGRTIWW